MILKRVIITGRDAFVQQLAQQVSQEVFIADSVAETLDIIKTSDPEMIMFDHRFNPEDIRQFCQNVHSQFNAIIVAVGDDQNCSVSCDQFLQAGADHYLHGQKDHHQLKEIVSRLKNQPVCDLSQKDSNDFFLDPLAESVSMVGKSKAVKRTIDMIKLVAASNCNPVLIIGQTGTGKELAAKAVHNFRHKDKPFVAVNCAALTANLLESELFGHAKGSFTSADREKTGLIELAQDGTIFLDEISEMPLDLQAKLLRVLQEKTFRKVGGTKEICCTATIIASSNRNLKNEVKAGRFRDDLYYRLMVAPVTISPLKSPDRIEDISLLVRFFLKTSTICPDKTNKISSITNLALQALQQHDWQGNVRELRNVIERAIILESTNKIGLSSIIIDPEQSDCFCNSPKVENMNISDFSLEKAERQLICRALQETNWQKTKAAELLGISRATLYTKVKQLNLESDPSFSQLDLSASPNDQPLTIA
jgi:DNA-binding NtrC family response regulator